MVACSQLKSDMVANGHIWLHMVCCQLASSVCFRATFRGPRPPAAVGLRARALPSPVPVRVACASSCAVRSFASSTSADQARGTGPGSAQALADPLNCTLGSVGEVLWASPQGSRCLPRVGFASQERPSLAFPQSFDSSPKVARVGWESRERAR